ncbi:unnamed protein product [Cylindrotheca closterium]|uniref:Uncharacterized protein n=1 Tax=Cylindrotheca closterium TaxID=2856 RepID=A0AAD2FYM7_9STRA|nr:unnamed protein product [Cylindrotheca closterium]
MTSIVPHLTPKTTNLSPGNKRRRLMPLTPTSQSSTPRHHDMAPATVQMPSMPSLSKIDDKGFMDLPAPTNRPRQRTESFDGAFCFDPAFVSPTVGQVRPRPNPNADLCIDHNSCNKRRPPFVDNKESDTFAAFTKPAEGSSFGASSSFIGLRGLLPEDARASQSSLARLLRRNSTSSAVGLDMNQVDDEAQPETRNEGGE